MWARKRVASYGTLRGHGHRIGSKTRRWNGRWNWPRPVVAAPEGPGYFEVGKHEKNFSSKDLQDSDYYSCFFMITFTMINRLKEKRPIYINICFLFPWTASGPRALRYGPSRPLTGMYGPFRALTGSYGPLRPPVPYEPLRALRALTGPPTDFYGVTGPRAWPTGPQAHGPMGLGKGS